MTSLPAELWCDGYKLDHRRQYPRGLTRVYSNLTPRSTRVPGVEDVVFFGLRHALDKIDEGFAVFFASDSDNTVERYQRRLNGYLGPNSIGTDHIRDLRTLGYLPVEVRALPEGTRVPLRVPMLTIENTHPDFAWLTNYLETILSAELWLPCTSATTALRLRRLIDRYADATGADPGFSQWQGHDFSFRGMAGVEAAAVSGAAHLLAFTGTDTLPAIDLIDRLYPPTDPAYFIGGSVAATEHSVMCAGGETGELETFHRLLDLYPEGIVSVVSDTWDLWNVLTNVLTNPRLKQRIASRSGKLVIRPDSGDPTKIVCGDSAEAGPAQRGALQILADTFGSTTNANGYQQLDSHIGLIYGDGINYERADAILSGMKALGFASSNIVFGVGSYTYQHVTRDTFGFAMKATWAEIDGRGVSLFKKPRTDDGAKNSARGRLAVVARGERLVLIENASPEQEAASLLRPVYSGIAGGFVSAAEGFDVIRGRLAASKLSEAVPESQLTEAK